jgi:sugar/nucleoside kinase (ribokinase family)
VNHATQSSPRVLFLGRTTLDVLYRLDTLPEEDSKVYARQMQAAPGGPAVNAAITNALLGGQSMLVTAIGDGPWAEPVRAELSRHSIALLDLAAHTAYETPLCSVLINTANSSRTIVNPPISTAPLPRLAAEWETAIPLDWGSIPPVVLTDGFFLSETLPLLTTCHSAGAVLCLDGGSWKSGTAELAPRLTAAICSERFTIPGRTSGPDAVFAWFAAQGIPYVAVTRGAKSILASDRGRRFEIEVAPTEATDTLGAGDVLHGAFCHHFALEANFENALRKGCSIATLSCRSLGLEEWAKEKQT